MTPSTHALSGGRQRGFALIASLLVLMLTAILAVTYLAVTTGERSQSSNVHVARSSLYAADAGVRTVEQWLANYAKAKLDSLAAYQSGTNPLIPSPNGFFPKGPFPGSTVTSGTPAFSATGSLAFYDTTLTPQSQSYDYLFTITSTGTRGTFGKRMVQSQGILRVSASRGTFADYLLFTSIHLMPDNSQIWFTSSGTFDGRMHTNGEYRFAYKPTFMDLVTSVNTKAWYYNNGNNKELAASNNGTIDQPNFHSGFTRGASTITLPTDPYNQQNAALGLDPSSAAQPTNSQIDRMIGQGGSGTPATGVYLPDTLGSVRGGIYVQGNLDKCLLSVDTNGNQVYVLTQGSSTDTIRVNRGTGTTTFYDASATPHTKVLTGTPRGILFSTGGISDLRGPDRVSGTPPPALALDSQLLVACNNDIVIQRDITCKNYDTGNNVLGIYSSGGSVRVGTGAPSNMNLDAYVMATGSSGAFEVDNYDTGSPRGTFHLRGGAVTKYYGAFYTFDNDGNLNHGYGRDFHYDQRGLVPPYYPTTPRMNPDIPTARTLAWKEL
jgi:type II secretory pathway pseudopilin PulG